IAVRDAPPRPAVAGSAPLRSRSLPAGPMRGPPPLLVHPVRRRAPQLHRLSDGDGRDQARRRADRATLRARSRSRPADRDRRGHDDAPALWYEDAIAPRRDDGAGRRRQAGCDDAMECGAFMTTSSSKRNTTRAQYDDAATRIPELNVLNYGFCDDAEESLVPPDAPEAYCLRLYEHTVRGAGLEDAAVLEVSCGRGGGAAFLARAFAPRRYVGIDLSDENVRLARERHAAPNLEFRTGFAESLDVPAASFDVVVNVEASHLYDDRAAFFAEVYR